MQPQPDWYRHDLSLLHRLRDRVRAEAGGGNTPSMAAIDRVLTALDQEHIELLTPDEWQARTGIQVLDPDGWRSVTAPSWETPITREDFLKRAWASTVKRWPDPFLDEPDKGVDNRHQACHAAVDPKETGDQ